MRKRFTVLDLFIVAGLFVVALYVWTLPIQENPLPYGEGDAAWHFGIGDWIAHQDRTITLLPKYISYWYYNYNKVLGTDALEYPPPNHINYAMMSIAGGDRVVPVYIYKAISSFIQIFGVYFLLRYFFDTPLAATAAFGAIFGFRDQQIYLFGQQPTLLALTFLPVIMYTYYRFFMSYIERKPRYLYLALTGLLLAASFLLHGQGVTVLFILGIFTLLMLLKHKTVYLTRKMVLIGTATAVVALALTLPFLAIYTGPGTPVERGEEITAARLLSWGIDPDAETGSFPDAFYIFNNNYPYPSLPVIGWSIFALFVVIGAVSLLLRRRDADLLLLSWLAGVYLILHMDVLFHFPVARTARMLPIETPLFYAFAAIGAFFVLSLLLSSLALSRQGKTYARYALAAFLIIFIFIQAGSPSIANLEHAYEGPYRITPEQVRAAEWINDNLPQDAVLVDYGTATYPKMRFMYMYAFRFMGFPDETFSDRNITPGYALVDYSDFRKGIRGQLSPDMVQQVELQLQNVSRLIYNENDIRIYELT